jgi:hypothetical protein
MKETLDRALGLFRKPPREIEQSVQERVAKRLGLEVGDATRERRLATPALRRWQWPVVAAVAAAIMLAVLIPTRVAESAPAVLEDATGKREIQYGELVRANGDMSAMLSITSGSRVEMRSESELTLERADDGHTRIRLKKVHVLPQSAEKSAFSRVQQRNGCDPESRWRRTREWNRFL